MSIDAGTPFAARPGSLSATRPHIPSTVAVARRNIRKIQGKFSTLVTRSCKRLQNRETDVDEVQTFLIVMFSSPNARDGIDIVTTVVESTKSLEEIFRALSKYRLWDYLNYFLLQSIIEEFANDDSELNDMMEHYQQDLTGYVLALRIQEYLDATHPIVATSDSENSGDEITPALQPWQKQYLFKNLSVKIDANITDHSLSYVTSLWHSLAKQFVLPRPAMILHNIAEGCIGITWLIPANLVKHVTRMARETANMLAEEHILRVKLEEQCIYPMEAEAPLPEFEATVFKRKVCFTICLIRLPIICLSQHFFSLLLLG